MPAVRVLTESDIRSAVGFGGEELAVIESVYPRISDGSASMPPIMRLDVPEHNGEIDVKTAHLPGHPGIAVKVSAGFFDNPSRGLPSLGGLMMVFDAETGIPRAALFDNGYLTDLRTALAGAVAASHLARVGSSTAGVVGAGMQAAVQLEALVMVRPIEHAAVWARRPDAAVAFAERMSERLGISVNAVEHLSDAAAADVLVTTTPATEPIVTEETLHPGVHVTAVGSDAEHKRELSAGAVRRADRFVCDSIDQSRRLGELRSAGDEVTAVELGEIVAGSVPGRTDEEEITICDLTGTGAQDTAIAGLAVRRAEAAGLGVLVDA